MLKQCSDWFKRALFYSILPNLSKLLWIGKGLGGVRLVLWRCLAIRKPLWHTKYALNLTITIGMTAATSETTITLIATVEIYVST